MSSMSYVAGAEVLWRIGQKDVPIEAGENLWVSLILFIHDRKDNKEGEGAAAPPAVCTT